MTGKPVIWVLLYVILPLASFLPPPVRASSGCTRANLMQTLPEEDKKLLTRFGGDWVKDAEVCVVGPYRVAVPAKGAGPTVFIWKRSGPLLFLQEGFGLNLFSSGPNARSSELLLTIQDSNKDEIYDRLDYMILSESSQPTGHITDLNMDGQLDIRVIAGKGKGQIWLKGEWRELHIDASRKGVIENGQFKAVEFRNGSWKYSE